MTRKDYDDAIYHLNALKTDEEKIAYLDSILTPEDYDNNGLMGELWDVYAELKKKK